MKLADLVGVGSASAFLLTILYLYGYSAGLGVNLFLYFSLNDYFRFAVECLPPMIVGGIIGALLGFVVTSVGRRATTEQLTARSPKPSVVTFLSALVNHAALPIALIVVAVVATFRFFHGGPRHALYVPWGAVGVVLWISLADWYTREPRVVGWTQPWRLCVMRPPSGASPPSTSFPALALFTVCYGLYAGETGRRLYLPPADVKIVLRDTGTPVAGRVLFLLDSYLVFRDRESGDVLAIPKSEVMLLSHEPLRSAAGRWPPTGSPTQPRPAPAETR